MSDAGIPFENETADDHKYSNGGTERDLNQIPEAVDDFARIQQGDFVPVDTHDDAVAAIIARETEEPDAAENNTNMVNTGDGDDALVSDATDVANAAPLVNLDATD